MFYIGYCLSFAILFGLSLSCFRKVNNPISQFLLPWALALFLNRQDWMGLYLPSDESYFMFYLSIWGYSIGFMFCFGFKRFTRTGEAIVTAEDRVAAIPQDSPWFVTVLRVSGICCFLYMLWGSFKTYALLSSQNAVLVRETYYATSGASVWGNVYFELVKQYFVVPAYYFCGIIAVKSYFKKRNYYDLAFIILWIVTSLLYDLLALSRAQIVVTISFLYLMLFYSKKDEGNGPRADGSKEIRYILLATIVFGGLFIHWISIERLAFYSWFNQFRLFGLYLAVPITLFDYRDFVMPSAENFYGTFTFSGLTNTLTMLVRQFGFEGLSWGDFGIRLQEYRVIGPGLTANALYSWCLPFYIDFGVLGVFIVPFCYGIMIGNFYKAFLKGQADEWLLPFTLGHIYAIMGVTDWKLLSSSHTILFALLIFFAVKQTTSRSKIRAPN